MNLTSHDQLFHFYKRLEVQLQRTKSNQGIQLPKARLLSNLTSQLLLWTEVEKKSLGALSREEKLALLSQITRAKCVLHSDLLLDQMMQEYAMAKKPDHDAF